MLFPEKTFTTDWTTPKQKRWAEHLGPLKQQETHGLEVGSYEGRSAVWFLENLCNSVGSTLTCVDTWHQPAVEQRFDQNMRTYRNMIKIKGASHEALKKLPTNHYDFIYIDGDHSAMAVLEDAVLSYRLLKIDGIMIFDDYKWDHFEEKLKVPKVGIDNFLETYEDRFVVIFKGYQVFLKKVI